MPVEPRLASRIRVDACRRLAEAEGLHATVLARGDPVAGSLLLIVRTRDGEEQAFEQVAGQSGWVRAGPAAVDELPAYFERRRRIDPDLWLLEIEGVSDLEAWPATLSTV